MNLRSSHLTALIVLLLVFSFAPAGCGGDKKKSGENALAVVEAPDRVPAQVTATAGYSDVAERAVKGVVNIASTKVVRTPQRNSPFSQDPFFRRFFGFPDQVPRERRERARGSGVLVTTDGYILTNNHVVEGADEVLVVLHDERELIAKIVGTDPKTDVAVLKVEATELEPLPLGHSSELRLGEVVLAIGNPFGLSHTVTQGIVSALGRARVGIADYEDFIQTDAAINPGNSGGALINTRGELVGINTAIASSSGGYQGVGFAIPADMAHVIMDSLVRYGHVQRGYLGVIIQDMRPDMAEQFGLKKSHGAIVSDVLENGPAGKAGLQRGDVVLRFAGQEVTDAAQLRNTVSQTTPDSEAEMTVLRDRKERTINVTIGRHPDDATAAIPTRNDTQEPDAKSSVAGLTVTGLTAAMAGRYGMSADTRGVIVVHVEQDGFAAEAGLQPGDVIMEVDRVPVGSVADFEKGVAQAKRKKLLLLINRGGATTFVVLRTK